MNQDEILSQLRQGMNELQLGNFAVSKEIFRSILDADSLNFHALHFLGVTYCQDGT